MRGFIFSIEALAAITILLVALLMLSQPSITPEQNSYFIIKNQNSRAIAFYTSDFPATIDTGMKYCGEIVYTPLGTNLEKTSICEGHS
jgi:hypothetical protein